MLVPEISLTPQAVHRFASRFPGRVALIHSQLSAGQQFDEWRRIRDGQADIVVGSRSAVFAPLPRLGLVIVDEEHEWAYKQSEHQPRYHAARRGAEEGRTDRRRWLYWAARRLMSRPITGRRWARWGCCPCPIEWGGARRATAPSCWWNCRCRRCRW